MWFHMRIIESCNLKCKHCYAMEYDKAQQMSLELFKDIINIIVSLPQFYNRGKTIIDRPVVYLSGGEPLLHKNLPEMLEYVYPRFAQINILTNGIFIPQKIALINKYKEKCNVQISMEGNKQTNDEIRGEGTYDQIINSLYLLKEKRIRHWISYTVSQTNKHAYKDFVDTAIQTNSFGNNVTPYIGDSEYMLSLSEWIDFKHNLMAYAEKRGSTRIHAPLSCGFSYNCGAYYCGMTFNPDGTCTGCARFPEKKRPYQEAGDCFIKKPHLMYDDCMKEKWGDDPARQLLRKEAHVFSARRAIQRKKVMKAPVQLCSK